MHGPNDFRSAEEDAGNGQEIRGKRGLPISGPGIFPAYERWR